MGLDEKQAKQLIKNLKLKNEQDNISKITEKLLGNSIAIESLKVIFGLMEI